MSSAKENGREKLTFFAGKASPNVVLHRKAYQFLPKTTSIFARESFFNAFYVNVKATYIPLVVATNVLSTKPTLAFASIKWAKQEM